MIALMQGLQIIRGESPTDEATRSWFSAKPQVKAYLRSRGIEDEVTVRSRGKGSQIRYYVTLAQRPRAGAGFIGCTFDLRTGFSTWECASDPEWTEKMNRIEVALQGTNAKTVSR